MAELAEFKIQVAGQSWEETEVAWQAPYDNTFWACYAAQCAARLTGKPIRWNWIGSSLGHYAHPEHNSIIPLIINEHSDLDNFDEYEAKKAGWPPTLLLAAVREINRREMTPNLQEGIEWIEIGEGWEEAL